MKNKTVIFKFFFSRLFVETINSANVLSSQVFNPFLASTLPVCRCSWLRFHRLKIGPSSACPWRGPYVACPSLVCSCPRYLRTSVPCEASPSLAYRRQRRPATAPFATFALLSSTLARQLVYRAPSAAYSSHA